MTFVIIGICQFSIEFSLSKRIDVQINLYFIEFIHNHLKYDSINRQQWKGQSTGNYESAEQLLYPPYNLKKSRNLNDSERDAVAEFAMKEKNVKDIARCAVVLSF